MHSYEHLSDALRLLDLRLRRRVVSFQREMRALNTGEQPHIFVSHAAVERILTGDPVDTTDGDLASEPSAEAEMRRLAAMHEALQASVAERVAASRAAGVSLPLVTLVHRFGLSPVEEEAVVMCLAPELRRSYDRVYAYLQDDVTRQRPSIDLVLQVLFDREADRWRARTLLEASATLRYAGLICVRTDAQSPSGSSGLAQFLRLDPRILQFLLGHSVLDPVLDGAAQLRRGDLAKTATAVGLPIASGSRDVLRRRVAETLRGDVAEALVVHLHGPRGAGRQALALDLAAASRRALLCLDAQRIPAMGDGGRRAVDRAVREARLLDVPLFVRGLARDDDRFSRWEQSVEAYGIVAVVASEAAWTPPLPFDAASVYQIACPRPSAAEQANVWREALPDAAVEDPGSDTVERLTHRFQLTPGQIRDAVRLARRQKEVRGATGDRATEFGALAAAARAQSTVQLGKLATKIELQATWTDLVLPADTREQLEEIEAQVRHRIRVFDDWGFDRSLRYGKGLSALFSGRPGTGKTLAAEVMAESLQLDLYAVDLSQVVSKYIGETEKNLSRIFQEAEDSNAILFFDEADALFGKRTEVSDAHDRYANVETSYLLQRMEAYDGMVVLASNLRENMDEAFLRRIRFVVEFPFPDARQRRKIWAAHFPDDAPVAAEVDLDLLAGEMQVAGGTIKNIVLNAAFFAAANGQVIGMQHLLRGARREYEKIGKLWDPQRFSLSTGSQR